MSADTPSLSTAKPCNACRRRKVRCDKAQPCANCARHGVACIYEADLAAPGNSDSVLHDRIERLERMIEQMSRTSLDTIHTPSSTPLTQGEAVAESGKADEPDHGVQLFEPHISYYGSPSFWMNLHEFVCEPRFLLRTGYDSADETGWPLSTLSSAAGLSQLHLPVEQENALFEYHMAHVEPFVRMAHQPTFRTAVAEFRRGISPIEREIEATMFSVQLLTVVAMPSQLVEQTLGQRRWEAIRHFRLATERAMDRANILRTRKVLGVQPLLYYLVGPPRSGCHRAKYI